VVDKSSVIRRSEPISKREPSMPGGYDEEYIETDRKEL